MRCSERKGNSENKIRYHNGKWDLEWKGRNKMEQRIQNRREKFINEGMINNGMNGNNRGIRLKIEKFRMKNLLRKGGVQKGRMEWDGQ